MDRQAFVEGIRRAVENVTVSDTISCLERPPGRAPAKAILRLSDWFKQLSSNDRQNAESVIQFATHAAVFGFFSVLDGVRFVEDGPDKGRFELHYLRGDEEITINDDTGDMLHDLFGALTDEWFDKADLHYGETLLRRGRGRPPLDAPKK
jgi:hypothetical protein